MNRWVQVVVLLVAFAATANAQNKPRVAIFDFDYATVHDYVGTLFGTDVDVGQGVADLLVKNLVQSGNYSVIEREQLDKILAEQNFSNSDRANATTAAKLGKILGVDAIIIGSITQFGRDDKSTSVGGGGFRIGGFGIGGVSRNQSNAVVAVDARMVNIDTAEIMAVAEGKGDSQRSGTSLLGAGGGSGGFGGGKIDMSNSNFAATILGEAVHEAVQALANDLDQNVGKVEARKVVIDGLVADAAGGILILNVGANAGVKVGDRLAVKRTDREIKDPATGAVIRRVELSVGEVVITEADASSSVGTFSGSGEPQVGDRVVSPE
jgi:curli biogenesis system outer membrane secretion channel CsgG